MNTETIFIKNFDKNYISVHLIKTYVNIEPNKKKHKILCNLIAFKSNQIK